MLNPRKLKYLHLGLSYVFRATRVFGPPMQVMIEPTNLCNFKCVYCPQSVPGEHFANGKGFMALADYERLIRKISKSWRGLIVNLIRDGEPTLHKDLVAMVRIAAEAGHKPQFSTNMSRMTPQLARELVDAGLYLVKSDFSHDRELFERLRAGGNWEGVRAGIGAMLDAVRASGRTVHVNVIEIGTFDKPADVAAAEVEKLRALFPEHRELLGVAPTHFHNALGNAAENLSQAGEFRAARYNLCHHPWLELVINFRGDAVGCCRDLRSEYLLGNVFTCGDIARDIWNGAEMRTLRRELLHKRPEAIPICAKCDLPYGSSYAGSGWLRKAVRFLWN